VYNGVLTAKELAVTQATARSTTTPPVTDSNTFFVISPPFIFSAILWQQLLGTDSLSKVTATITHSYYR